MSSTLPRASEKDYRRPIGWTCGFCQEPWTVADTSLMSSLNPVAWFNEYLVGRRLSILYEANVLMMCTAGSPTPGSTIFCFSCLFCESYVSKMKGDVGWYSIRQPVRRSIILRPSIPCSRTSRKDRHFENNSGLSQPSSFYQGVIGVIFAFNSLPIPLRRAPWPIESSYRDIRSHNRFHSPRVL